MTRRTKWAALGLMSLAFVGSLFDASRTASAEEPLAPGDGVLVPAVDDDAPSVAVLPPVVDVAADEDVQLLAELATDRVAQEVALAGKVQLVDRASIELVLSELELSSQQIRPLVSYDALCRLRVVRDGQRLASRLHVVDLSSGNAIAEKTFPWPLDESHVAGIRQVLTSALPQVGRYQPGRKRVRFLGAQTTRDHIRVRPLAERLQLVFEESLKSSDGLLLVAHLEAGSTREESLFLLMGLSRLPGGRQFVPQADAAVELRVREVDAIGRTLDDVGVELGLRLNSGKSGSDWIAVSGRVGEADELIERLWQRFSSQMSQLKSIDVGGALHAMATRRTQAEAEARAIRSLPVARPSEETLDRWQAHAETALKLDPTYHRGMYELIDVNRHRIAQPVPAGENDANAIEVLKLAADYLQRFDQPPQDASSVQNFASMAVNGTQLRTLRFRDFSVGQRSELTQAVVAAQQIVESVVGRNVRFTSSACSGLFAVAGRGMRHVGIPELQRRDWIERMLRLRADQSLQLVDLDGTVGPDPSYRMWRRQYRSFVCHFLVTALQLACEEGWKDLADSILADLKPLLDVNDRTHGTLFKWVQQAFSQPGFESQRKAFTQWEADVKELPAVDFLKVDWPVLASLPPTSPQIQSRFKTTVADAKTVSPVAIVDGRLIVLIGDRVDGTWSAFADHASSRSPVKFGWLPVQPDGQPLDTQSSQEAIQLIVDPPGGPVEDVFCAQVVDGRAFFGTRNSGLVVFDPASNEWTSHGTESGLPANSVHRVWPIGDHTLFCTGLMTSGPARSVSELFRTAVHFTLDIRTGESRLRARCDLIRRNSPGRLDFLLGDVWRHEDEWRGIGPTGVWRDLLAGNRGRASSVEDGGGDSMPELHFAEQFTAHGWKHRHTGYRDGKHDGVVIDGRRFVSNSFRLAELDQDGAVKNAWHSRHRVIPTESPNLFLFPWQDSVFQMPADSPYLGEFIIACDDTVVCLSDRNRIAMLYEPVTDLWSGPVVLPDRPAFALATDRGFWTAGSSLQFISLDRLKAAAKGTNRVISTAKFRMQMSAAEEQLDALGQAQIAFTRRQFGRSASLLSTYLVDHPEHPVALHLAGLVHGPSGLNDTEAAVQFFRRLADVQGNPAASFTGLVNLIELHRKRGDLPAAADTSRELLEMHPKIRNSLVRQTAERMIQTDRLRRLRRSAATLD